MVGNSQKQSETAKNGVKMVKMERKSSKTADNS